MKLKENFEKIAKERGLAFKTLKVENGMIKAAFEPKNSLLEKRKELESFFPFMNEEDRQIYRKDYYDIFIPDDEDIEGWKETIEAIERYFGAEAPKYAKKRKRRGQQIPKQPKIKKYKVLENGNLVTTTAGASMYNLAGPLVQIGLEVVTDDPTYEGRFSGLVNLTKKPIKIKPRYRSTCLGYTCDDLVVGPGQVIVQTHRGNGYCFSTYIVGYLEEE